MAVTAKVYGLAMQSMLNAEIDFDTATVKCMLLDNNYTPDQDTHRYKSDLSHEVSGTGYTTGGVTLTSKTVTYTGASNTLTLDAADPTWTSLTVTNARYAIFYVDTGTAATSPLISYMDFGANQSPSAQNFVVVLASTGILTITAA